MSRWPVSHPVTCGRCQLFSHQSSLRIEAGDFGLRLPGVNNIALAGFPPFQLLVPQIIPAAKALAVRNEDKPGAVNIGSQKPIRVMLPPIARAARLTCVAQTSGFTARLLRGKEVSALLQKATCIAAGRAQVII